MAPKVRKKVQAPGQTREDAARDRMKDYKFMDCVIDEGIKQLLQMYGEDPWFLIESENYYPLLDICLEKQEQLTQHLPEEEQLAEKQKEIALEEQQQQDEYQLEQEQHVENVKEEIDQADLLSTTNDDPSPAAFQALSGFATHSVAVDGMHCGWLSTEEEDSDGDDGGDDDDDDDGDDDEMIPLTPEPLCEELVKKVRGLRKRKKETSSD